MYKHILFAVEFGKGTDLAIDTIKQLANLGKSKISIVHVIEMPILDIYPELSVQEKEKRYIELTKQQLARIGDKLEVPKGNQYIETGNPKVIIPMLIKQNDVDLLVVGHHERHGIYRIVGSTVYALLSNAKCAVLTLPYPPYE